MQNRKTPIISFKVVSESALGMIPKVSVTDYGLTPAQYHAGLDKLWDALGLEGEGVQDKDVFTLVPRRSRNPGKRMSEKSVVLVENCQLEFQRHRGVLYVHGPEGATILRVSQIPLDENVLDGDGKPTKLVDVTDYRGGWFFRRDLDDEAEDDPDG